MLLNTNIKYSTTQQKYFTLLDKCILFNKNYFSNLNSKIYLILKILKFQIYFQISILKKG